MLHFKSSKLISRRPICRSAALCVRDGHFDRRRGLIAMSDPYRRCMPASMRLTPQDSGNAMAKYIAPTRRNISIGM
jgi:hypothetical protein